jgi:hypothetical protein
MTMQLTQGQIDALGGCGECQFGPPPPAEAPAEGGSSVVVVDPTKAAWIVIELVESTGRARAGEPFSVTPPGGTPIEGSLDAKGKVRIEGLDPGQCSILFPALGYQQDAATSTSPPATDP